MEELLLGFLVSVIAGVVSYYICKWLEGDDYTAPAQRHKPPYINGIEIPQRRHPLGYFVFAAYGIARIP